MDKKVKWKMIIVAVLTVLLAGIIFLSEIKRARVDVVERNEFGKGGKKERYEVTVDGRISREPIELEIGERRYTTEEMKKLFRKTMDELEKIMLGENKSVDHVETDLNLITRMPDSSVDITWESSRNDIINSRGEIQSEKVSETGEMVELRGLLTCGEEESMYVVNVMVYPKSLSGKEELLDKIQKLFAVSEENQRESRTVSLPKTVGGEQIIWERKRENRGIAVLFLGGVVVLMFWIQEKQSLEKEKRERMRQMKMDYPEIISQIALLVGAGLTVKNAWKKIALNYQEHKNEKGIRYAYEEMNYTLREMQGGVTEVESYEHFGKRCGLSAYMKLGALLSQSLRKGTKGLVKILTYESEQAWEERKQMAKKTGEETSTKLLLPMSLMLIVVLIIVIVPAFLSISI